MKKIKTLTPGEGWSREVISAWNEAGAELQKQYIDFVTEEFELSGGLARAKALEQFGVDFKASIDLARYRKGGEGAIAWIEEQVRFKVPVKEPGGYIVYKWMPPADLPSQVDQHGRSFKTLWEFTKKELCIALEMDETGNYKRRLNLFCWPRGEAKSFLTILIILHRFFNFPFQRIYLIGSSREQSGDNLLGEIAEIIQNSPTLDERVGGNGILADLIRIQRSSGGRFNFIRLLSTFSGLRSNATMIAQTEAFEVDDEKFFAKWFGSLRNVPNGMGIVDTTVSTKKHWLYRLYSNYQTNPTGPIYFSYRCSKDAVPEDYNHPLMTAITLETYRTSFTKIDFERFFKNLWDDIGGKVFSPIDIAAIKFLGYDHKLCQHSLVKDTLLTISNNAVKEDPDAILDVGKLWRTDDVFSLGPYAALDKNAICRGSTPVKLDILKVLTQIYQTHWAICVGVDMSDALKNDLNAFAKSIVVTLAKGLQGSLKDREKGEYSPIYVVLDIANIENHQPSNVIQLIKWAHKEFKGISQVTSEPYGMAHVMPYCVRKGIPFLAKASNKERQTIGVRELSTAIMTGRFKSPNIPVPGKKGGDILVEELENYDVISTSGKYAQYGSPTKAMKHGIQDDVIDAILFAIYGSLSIDIKAYKQRERGQDVIPLGVYPSKTKSIESKVSTMLLPEKLKVAK